MFRWLNGPGAAFRDPLPGSTNYLNAYDPSGNLVRARTETSQDREDEGDEGAESEPGMVRNVLDQNIASGKPIPKETADDLVPFPMNRQFRSQPVLSEELRDEIYRRVKDLGHTVRAVSEALLVDMRRVGAVCRLKTIEERWLLEVCRFAFHFRKLTLLRCYDETSNNSISLEDSTMVISKQITTR